MTKWGLVATIKAPAQDILRFAAYHLELGAHRLYIYLDAPDPATYAILKSHSKIRVTNCNNDYWSRSGSRPAKHQVRQTRNATHAYNRRTEVDWLIHMDVDEFLWPDAPVANILANLPPRTYCARLRPIEALAGDGTLFKGFIPPGPERSATVARLYPTYGQYLRGGFLSHVAGKLFVRTGMANVTFKIHNVFCGDDMNPGHTELPAIELCHCHAKSWEDWIATYRYRLQKGSYRADLAGASAIGGTTLHDLFRQIETTDGQTGLRAFYDEVCADSPALMSALRNEGLLRHYKLDLDAKMTKHFPNSP